MIRAPHTTLATALPLVLLLASACGDVPVKPNNFAEPSGNIKGTVTYSGPLPCTQLGVKDDGSPGQPHVVGAAAILLFKSNLLPPPDGLGRSARSLAVVAGDVLFSSVQSQLPNPTKLGEVACPPPDAPHVTVSAEWIVGPVPAGRYQVRGFYDRDGDFSPLLKIHQLPTAGDVGGGALTNAPEAALGAAPRYATIVIGDETAEVDPQGLPVLKMPAAGALVEGVAVTLGRLLDTARPITHVVGVVDERVGKEHVTDVARVTMPIDQLFTTSPTMNVAQADKEFIRMRLRAGLPEAEQAAATDPRLAIQGMPPFNSYRLFPVRDADGDVIRTTPPIPDTFPQVIFARLDPTDTDRQTTFGNPAVIIQAVVSEVDKPISSNLSLANAKTQKVVSEVQASLRPSAICAQPEDPYGPLYIVTPSVSAIDKSLVIADLDALRAVIAKRFRRPITDVRVVEGCIPPGKFSMNVVHDTGQAWTLPNEAGVCTGVGGSVASTRERPTADGAGCTLEHVAGARPRLPSQDWNLFVGGRSEPGYCESLPLPIDASLPSSKRVDAAPEVERVTSTGQKKRFAPYTLGIPSVCLTTAELEHPETVARRIENPWD
ncbi:MAG: hypothetical protein IT374_19580 [Polyangiaceae bacterium]|nr:hypothetical protein [Polyangiaceae bacterium]